MGEEDSFKTWDYGLYSDTENETNIKDVYTRIYITIETEVYSINTGAIVKKISCDCSSFLCSQTGQWY